MKDLRCLLTLHSFVEHHIPDGHGVYLECRRCGKVSDAPEPSGEMLRSQNPFVN